MPVSRWNTVPPCQELQAGGGRQDRGGAGRQDLPHDCPGRVEVTKQEIHHIPAITDTLGTLPLKFILFIDDLSFSKNDDNFSALKANIYTTYIIYTSLNLYFPNK